LPLHSVAFFSWGLPMRYDRFDVMILLSILICLAAASVYAFSPEAAKPRPGMAGSASVARICSDLARDRALVDTGQGSKAVQPLQTLIAANPDIAEAHLVLAKAYAATEQYPSSIREYKATLVLDPEYADKASPKYLGKSIKAVLSHGWAPCEISLEPAKNDAEHAAVLADAQYITRLMAGGCQ